MKLLIYFLCSAFLVYAQDKPDKQEGKKAVGVVKAEHVKKDAADAMVKSDKAEDVKKDVAEPSTEKKEKEDDAKGKKDKAEADEKEVAAPSTQKKEIVEPSEDEKEKKEVKEKEKPVEKKEEKAKPEAVTKEVVDKDVQKVEAEKKKVTTAEALLQAGIDTVDLEGGNWLLKRQALEKTLDLAEGINEVFSIILKTRMNFVTQRNQADKKFDQFIGQIGFELGELTELVNSLIEDLEDERTEQGALTVEEREALDQLEKKLNTLKQMQEDIKALSDLDNAIDDVLIQVEKEIDRASAYQKKGWANVLEIKKVLSDEKAEEL